MRTRARIKIYTRSFDLALYRSSKGLFEQLGFPMVRLTDQSSDGYFYTMLKDTDCDIAINIDEDTFVVDPQAVLDLVDYVVENNYADAGCPDGGACCPRRFNPIVTNPFFNILNLKLIRTKYDRKEVESFDYLKVESELIAKYPPEMLKEEYKFDYFDYERYNRFFFWLAYNFDILYLPSEFHKDNITTILYDLQGRTICMHSWFARFYSLPSIIVNLVEKGAGNQRRRINAVRDEVYELRNLPIPQNNMMDWVENIVNYSSRWLHKIPQRMSAWPYKIKRNILRCRRGQKIKLGEEYMARMKNK